MSCLNAHGAKQVHWPIFNGVLIDRQDLKMQKRSKIKIKTYNFIIVEFSNYYAKGLVFAKLLVWFIIMMNNLDCYIVCGMDFNTFKYNILQSPNKRIKSQTESQLKLFNCIRNQFITNKHLNNFCFF